MISDTLNMDENELKNIFLGQFQAFENAYKESLKTTSELNSVVIALCAWEQKAREIAGPDRNMYYAYVSSMFDVIQKAMKIIP